MSPIKGRTFMFLVIIVCYYKKENRRAGLANLLFVYIDFIVFLDSSPKYNVGRLDIHIRSCTGGNTDWEGQWTQLKMDEDLGKNWVALNCN
uniref:Uncharacterized protein n=1 Tax=Romanomermis culicivorax TaxID=13658 RepID=A0A915KQM4_ROMCU